MANKSALVASPSKMLDISSFHTSTYNVHAKTFSYYQAYKDESIAQQYLSARNALPTLTYTNDISTAAPRQHVTHAPRVISHTLTAQAKVTPMHAPAHAPTRMPEIINDPKQRMHASVGGRTSNDLQLLVHGCICVFCKHQFVQEIRNVHQAIRRAWDFCNDTIHSDYCKNCLRSGYVMRSTDVAGQDLGVIRDMLTDLIDTQNLARCVGGTID